MPPTVSRNTFSQAFTLYSIVAKKYAWATALSAVFCASEALLEQQRGKHDMMNGMLAGAAAGAAFGVFRPWPQPMAWPFAFAAVAAGADIIGEKIPECLQGYRWVCCAAAAATACLYLCSCSHVLASAFDEPTHAYSVPDHAHAGT